MAIRGWTDSGLALLEDRQQLAELDSIGRRLAVQNIPVDHSLGPNNSELCAGLTASRALAQA